MRLLDLFCCAGGAATGYHRAGFEVVGVDIEPQPNYPYAFIQADALDALARLAEGFTYRGWLLSDFDAIHASPPCQAHSDLQKQSKREYPDFIEPIRELLIASDLPYVIENVEGAPLDEPIVLCGTMFPGLRVLRHRLFESNVPLTAPAHPSHPLVFTHDKRKAHYGQLDQDTSFVQVTGGGNCTVANKRAAMGVLWMTGREANEAIPPDYTEYVGRQLLSYERKDPVQDFNDECDAVEMAVLADVERKAVGRTSRRRPTGLPPRPRRGAPMPDVRESVRRGSAFRYFDLTIVVTRVARDGEWADVRVTQTNGVGWSKRMPLPIPASWLPAAEAQNQQPGGGAS
jgi:DNA (cytosine-5)-methyltransferase 1